MSGVGEVSTRRQRILVLALPIVGGMISQNVLNMVDIAMVGTLGDAALAAVGVSSFATVMIVSLVAGPAGGGVQAIAARREGEGRSTESAIPLNGGLLIALAIGVPVSLVLVWATPWAFPLLNPDPDVVAEGVPYTQARMLATTAVAMNMSFRGFWNGIGRSRVYLGTILVIHASNIFLNWVLIFGNLGAPALGTLGAGIASALATGLGTAVYAGFAIRRARAHGFLRGLPDAESLGTMLRIGSPEGLRQFSFFLGFTALFWIVGRVGTAELAGAAVLMNLTLVAILPGLGLGLAAATLVGQAMGRGDVDDARRWGWDVAKVAAVGTLLVAVPFVAAPDPILGVFLSEPATVELARLPLRCVGATLIFDVLGLVLLNAHVGAGDTRRMFVVSLVLQWGLALPAAWLVGPVYGLGLLGIWLTVVGWRLVASLIFAVSWQRGAWAVIQL
jgi:putative MATE family efflux protein